MSDAVVDLRRRDPLAASPASALESLAEELRPVAEPTVELLVDARPGWSVVFSTRVDGPQVEGWRLACRDDTHEGRVDEHLWNRTILAGQCRELRHAGTATTDEAGRTVTFGSETLWRLLGVPTGSPSGATAAVKAFYVDDFAVQAAANELLAEAGFGRRPKKAPDPTSGSSSS